MKRVEKIEKNDYERDVTFKITFWVLDKEKILDFLLVGYEKIRNKNIYSEALARTVLKDGQCNISAEKLTTLFRFYMGEREPNEPLGHYILYLLTHKFYSPYQPNLRVTVEIVETED